MVVHYLPKVKVPVRFWYPAPQDRDTTTIMQNKIRTVTILFLALLVCITILSLINDLIKSNTSPNAKMVTLYEGYMTAHIYDEATDTVIGFDKKKEKMTFFNLHTQSMVFESPGTQSDFYIPGQYLHIYNGDTDVILSLTTFKTRDIVVQNLGDSDDKASFLTKVDTLTQTSEQGVHALQTKTTYRLFIDNAEQTEYYRVENKALPFPQFGNLISTPFLFDKYNPTKNGITYIPIDDGYYRLEHGPNDFSVEIYTHKIDVVGAVLTSKDIRIRKHNQLVKEFTIRNNADASQFIFFPHGRQDIYILSSKGIRVIELRDP